MTAPTTELKTLEAPGQMGDSYHFQFTGTYPSAVIDGGRNHVRASAVVAGYMTVLDAHQVAGDLGLPFGHLGSYIAREPDGRPGYPLVTGDVLPRQLVYLAEEHCDQAGGFYVPVALEELDYETVDNLLLMLASNTSTEEWAPGDWYSYYPCGDGTLRERMARYSVDFDQVYRPSTEEELAQQGREVRV